jgi:hypothetical protein
MKKSFNMYHHVKAHCPSPSLRSGDWYFLLYHASDLIQSQTFHLEADIMFNRSILKQDSVVTINGTSQIPGGSDADTVNIDTVMHLRTAEPEEITVVLPQVTGDPNRAYIRLMDEVENRQDFVSPVDPEQLEQMDDEQREKLLAAIEASRAQWEAVKQAAGEVKLSTLQLKAGDQELKFFMHKDLKPNAEGIYELQFIAPFSNFKIDDGQFTMSLTIILPRGAQLVSYNAVNPQGGPQPELRHTVDASLIGRHMLLYWMQYDPIFTIQYRY